eukprot:scaffold950_cov360-Pavlova_lutheri.AAC.15
MDTILGEVRACNRNPCYRSRIPQTSFYYSSRFWPRGLPLASTRAQLKGAKRRGIWLVRGLENLSSWRKIDLKHSADVLANRTTGNTGIGQTAGTSHLDTRILMKCTMEP